MELLDKLNILMKRYEIKNIAQLSRETQIPYTTLKSIFNGDVNDIRLSTSRKLCKFFNITLDDLLDDNLDLDAPTLSNKLDIDLSKLTNEEFEEVRKFIEYLISRRNE